MPRPRLSPDQVDFIMKMKALEYSNSEIARKLGVTEGAIRTARCVLPMPGGPETVGQVNEEVVKKHIRDQKKNPSQIMPQEPKPPSFSPGSFYRRSVTNG